MREGAAEVTGKQFFTVEEVATLMSVKQTTVRSWLTTGRLGGFKLPGGQWRVPRSKLETFVNLYHGSTEGIDL